MAISTYFYKKGTPLCQNGCEEVCEFGDYLGELDEDTEMQNLPTYTEQKADGIYRYR